MVDAKNEGMDRNQFFIGVINEFRNPVSEGGNKTMMQGFQVISFQNHPDFEHIKNLPCNSGVLAVLHDYDSDFKNSSDKFKT